MPRTPQRGPAGIAQDVKFLLRARMHAELDGSRSIEERAILLGHLDAAIRILLTHEVPTKKREKKEATA